MELTPRIMRQIVLFSMVLVIVPMVIFPNQFGSSLVRASLINAFIELVFYGLVLFFLNRRTSLINLVQASGLCLVYRLALGGLFGLVIAAMYSMNLRVSVTLGVSSYLPVILLQIAATPFVLRPLLLQSLSLQAKTPVPAPKPAELGSSVEAASAGPAPAPLKADQAVPVAPIQNVPFAPASSKTRSASRKKGTPSQTRQEVNGFDRATRYIGEDASVALVAVVDNEGLILSYFQRGGIDPEEWAPLAHFTRTNHTAALARFGWGDPSGIKLDFPTQRVDVSYDERFAMIVVADRQGSETLSIRINQALETVRQYLSQQYDESVFENLEISHV